MRYRHLFGPVQSRRFRRSLGVDLVPFKTCSFDCVFCQLGATTHNTLARKEYVLTGDVAGELDGWVAENDDADYITLAGSGEPTLHLGFGDVLAHLKTITSIPTALLTNGSTLSSSDVWSAACLADVVKVSLSAWDEESFVAINRPHEGMSLAGIVDSYRFFRSEYRGQLWLEVFVVPGANSSRAQITAIAGLAKSFAPDRIHLNTAVRPSAEESVDAVPSADLQELTFCFEPPAEAMPTASPQSTTSTVMTVGAILGMVSRRPCGIEDIASVLGLHPNEVVKVVSELERSGDIRRERRGGTIFCVRTSQSRMRGMA